MGEGVLALTERDHYPTSRSRLHCQLPFRGYIIPCLMRSQVVTWLARLGRHTTFAPQLPSLFQRLRRCGDVACQVGKEYNICPQASRSCSNTWMLWVSFGVYNVFRHYVIRALRLVFLVLTVTITSLNESYVLRAAASTSEGRGYYYDYL